MDETATSSPERVDAGFPAQYDDNSVYQAESGEDKRVLEDSENEENQRDEQQQLIEDLENSSGNDEDVIPTAIVIKNIPFAIKKEQLLDVIAKMNLPLPYAFNYHFDNGVFRGLAFANFTNTNETTQVLTSLNGKEIGGRRLRVEYKKMLPQAERERIEREKREKRGQLEEQHKSLSNLSLHSLGKASTNVNPSNTQLFSSFFNEGTTSQGNNKNPGVLSAQNTAASYYQPQLTQSQHQQPSQQGQSSNAQQAQQVQQQMQSTIANNALGNERYYAPLPSSSTLPLPPQQLDFNDPDTLEIYSQLLLFKDRERYYYELAYPLGLSAAHKRIINVLCSFLGLVEVFDPTFIVIRRKLLDHATLQSHLQQQGQTSMLNPLQPNSTGGSMNRSHSYTSLLQAHAAASVAAASNTSNNLPTNAGNSANIGSSSSATTTPKLSNHAQMAPQSSSQNNASQVAQAGAGSPSQLMQPIALHNTEAQPTQQQQQQSFLRQQAALTPSSRIPSGYVTNHSQLSSVNPLLRNSGISPPAGNVQPNTTQHRVPPSFFANPPNNLQLPDAQQQQSNSQLLPQHTNGSIHSNFSVQSVHDDSLSAANGNDIMYTSLSHTGFGNGLEEGLSRSLSGLDLQANAAGNNTMNGNPNSRKTLW